MYGAFASVYDALMDTVDYAAWAAYYKTLMEKCRVPAKGRVVECACGTGSLTLPLRRMGYQMTGADASEEMLAAAMEKARTAGVMIPFVRQDMRQLTVPRRVDCVLATCDGVNYLTSPEDVRAFFAAAFAALKPGGALIFDARLTLLLSFRHHQLSQRAQAMAPLPFMTMVASQHHRSPDLVSVRWSS